MLVIGSTGFIGSHSAEFLTDAGFSVTGTSTTGERADLACDITDQESVDRAISRISPDAILITAGQASVALAWDDPAATFATNISGPFHVLDAVRRLRPSAHVTFASSAGVYGPPPSADAMPFTEQDPMNPESPYGASKAAAEMLCRQFVRQSGLQIAITRIFNQIGPGQSDAQAPAEFSREIAKAERRGERVLELPVGNRLIRRDFTDVRDTARAWAQLIERRVTGTFNVCTGVETSLEGIIEGLAELSEITIEIDEANGPRRPGDILSVYGSHERLTAATGWRPQITLESSLADLLADMRRRV